MSRSFFNWTYVQRLIDKQLTNGWAIGIQANLVWYLTIISNSGRNKRLLRSLPCTSHSCNPRLHLQLNNATAPFGTTKALPLLHTSLGVLISSRSFSRCCCRHRALLVSAAALARCNQETIFSEFEVLLATCY